MKIIVSHDVDHLYRNDHLRDLYYPKLWVRETLAGLRGRISAGDWARRMAIPFRRELNHLAEIMRFDRKNEVPSTFFFGMEKGLGISYGRKQALEAIRRVRAGGFAAGVHGIAYRDAEGIRAEYQAFRTLTGSAPEGIRMHYVRLADNTLQALSEAGYAFDTTVFDKKTGFCIEAPYKVGGMWEFPLTIMDTYLPYDERQIREKTLDILQKAETREIPYCTVLVHDTNYSAAYPVYRDWYEWLIGHCRGQGIGLIGYHDAVRELNASTADAEK